MSLTFKHSGKCGDIIFALPLIQVLGGGVLYLPEKAPEVYNLHSNMQRLLDQQSYIHSLLRHPDLDKYEANPLNILIDLDHHRQHRERGRVNMVKRYFDVFRIHTTVPDSWLAIEGDTPLQRPYSVVNITPRFRDHSRVTWERVLYTIPGPVMFIGSADEAAKYPSIPYHATKDAYDLALVIKHADAVYCNQSFVYALAVAMGKKTYLEVKPGKTNCLGFNNVNILT